MVNTSNQIDATCVQENNRNEMLPKFFGRHFMDIEKLIYQHAEKLSSDYRGGYWEFYTLSNGGFFMSLDRGMFDICVPGNGFSHTVNGWTFGIIVSLFALNNAAWMYKTVEIDELYRHLLDYASQQQDADLIFSAID